MMVKHRSDNVESNALWSICMYTYLRKIGPLFVVNFFKLLFPPFLMNRNILHILLVKRSLVPYEALSCSIEYCVLFIILKGKLKRFGFVHENSKDLVLFMKTETFNAINNSHKRCFFRSFYYDTPLGFGSLWTPMCTSCTSCPLVWCAKNMSNLDLIWFSPIDGVISLVMRKKKFF